VHGFKGGSATGGIAVYPDRPRLRKQPPDFILQPLRPVSAEFNHLPLAVGAGFGNTRRVIAVMAPDQIILAVKGKRRLGLIFRSK